MNEEIKDIINEFLENLYFCTRVWTAWSYETMVEEDFIPLNEDEDFVLSFYNFLLTTKLDEEKIYFFLEDQIDVYYNDNISNFNSENFNDDWISFLDINEFHLEIQEKKIANKLKHFVY